MGTILNLIEGYKTGDNWEDLCVQCYRLRYQNDNYIHIPAISGGDAGIEGFTNNGIVHQCYCPEREYSDNDLYEHLRDKLSEDIGKLLKNGNRLKALGVPPIVEWHFNIPEYKDSRIISHVETKRQEVLNAKNEKPEYYTYIADSFRIVIKTAEDLKPEICRLIRTNLADLQLNQIIKHSETPDWSKCDSEKVANIRRKIKAVMSVQEDNNEDLNKVVSIYIENYISGLEIMNNLRTTVPEVYEDIFQLEQSYKREVSVKTLMNTNKSMNISLFETILNEFQVKLERVFSQRFNETSISELKQDLVASWLADCSMEFRSI